MGAKDLCARGSCQKKHKSTRKKHPFLLQCLVSGFYGQNLTWYSRKNENSWRAHLYICKSVNGGRFGARGNKLTTATSSKGQWYWNRVKSLAHTEFKPINLTSSTFISLFSFLLRKKKKKTFKNTSWSFSFPHKHSQHTTEAQIHNSLDQNKYSLRLNCLILQLV